MAEALAVAGRAGAVGEAIASCFEVHVLRDERWVIDCMSEHAEDALANAHDLARRAEVLGVKVIHERYNPRTDLSAARIVFCALKPPRPKARRLAPVGAFASRPGATTPDDRPSGAPLAAEAPWQDARPPTSLASPPAARRPAGRRPPAPDAGSWHLFAWASLGLAVTASLLFVLLLLAG